MKPILAIGNNELEGQPDIGETTACWMCGRRHPVEYGSKILENGTEIPSKLLAFFKCNGETYLCGINGKELNPPRRKYEAKQA